ncbi:hypothetical protein [Vibrio phage XZ1]|uniref:Uncharacterized protein n=1 Tax=Vibrio phage phi-Grn1 TaxID=1747713 RepID=A0A126HGV5_9CAUD|nr:hypothetical protein phiGrn1_0379 [Vibrio phage phi-Grn1]UOL51213.1 hypothetical protein [Vibrio phage XZ1]
MKPLKFVEAFSKEERAAMTIEERSRLRKIYNERYQEYVDKYINVFTRKDFRRERCWVILARCKKTGEIIGRIENSFSMGWSKERVRVIRPYLNGNFTGDDRFSKAEYNKACAEYITHHEKQVKSLREAYKDTHDVFLSRVGSKNCPVSIDWDTYYNKKDKRNFEYRNLKFKTKS